MEAISKLDITVCSLIFFFNLPQYIKLQDLDQGLIRVIIPNHKVPYFLPCSRNKDFKALYTCLIPSTLWPTPLRDIFKVNF